MAPTAQAGAPNNDTWRSAKNVTSLPFHGKVNTTRATDESDPPAGTKDASAHSVWWHIKLAKSGPVLISTEGSNYHLHLSVFEAKNATTSPDKWNRVGGFAASKGSGVMVRDLQARKHYFVMIGTHDKVNGGTAKLLVRRPAEVSYTLAQNGVYDRVDGSAVIHGTIMSTQPGTSVNMSVGLRQLVGTRVVTGWGSAEVIAGPQWSDWTLRITSDATFEAGAARVDESWLNVVDHGARVETLHFDPGVVVNLK
jgi:hypothetical protein